MFSSDDMVVTSSMSVVPKYVTELILISKQPVILYHFVIRSQVGLHVSTVFACCFGMIKILSMINNTYKMWHHVY